MHALSNSREVATFNFFAARRFGQRALDCSTLTVASLRPRFSQIMDAEDGAPTNSSSRHALKLNDGTKDITLKCWLLGRSEEHKQSATHYYSVQEVCVHALNYNPQANGTAGYPLRSQTVTEILNQSGIQLSDTITAFVDYPSKEHRTSQRLVTTAQLLSMLRYSHRPLKAQLGRRPSTADVDAEAARTHALWASLAAQVNVVPTAHQWADHAVFHRNPLQFLTALSDRLQSKSVAGAAALREYAVGKLKAGTPPSEFASTDYAALRKTANSHSAGKAARAKASKEMTRRRDVAWALLKSTFVPSGKATAAPSDLPSLADVFDAPTAAESINADLVMGLVTLLVENSEYLHACVTHEQVKPRVATLSAAEREVLLKHARDEATLALKLIVGISDTQLNSMVRLLFAPIEKVRVGT